ncbi:hypothetical protein [Lysobacter antibioticus]|uniref:hypothetical protein n=1 Tax=Lysobacter antibioticus TaxID=84531 RepID=UPI0011E01E03|nr:hypothetical protein [Lysobacter antibioticus]
MKWILLVLSPILLAALSAADAESCDAPIEEAREISIVFVGERTGRSSAGSATLGKYRITNSSAKPFELAAYRGLPPLRAYPMDALVEYLDPSGQWVFDLVALDHPEPANKIVGVKPGRSYEFVASGSGGPRELYRLKLRQPDGCWHYSQPFKFSQHQAKPVQ